jgi:Sec-independent protein translocase protein TatA
MDALEQYLSGGGSVAAPPKPTGGKTVASDVQSKRDQDALAIIQQELGAAQSRLASATDPQEKMRHQADIAALQREIARKSKTAMPAPAAPAAQTTQAAPAAPSDPLEAFFTGKPIAAQPVAVAPTSNAGAGRGSYEGYSQAGEAGGKVKAAPITVQSAIDQPSTAVRQIFGNVLKKGFEARQQLGERTAGVVDTLYGVVPATYGAVTQAFARASQTPEQAEQTGQTAASAVGQPVGKAAGITGKETYQQPLGGITQPIAEQINKMFNVLGMTPEQISEKTGIPAPDIRNMVVIGSAALPQAVKETGQVVGQVKPLISKVTQPLREMAKDIEIVRPGQLSKAEAQAQFEARQAPAGSAGAAAATNNPFAGKITGEETVRGQFPQIKLSKTPTDVPVNEQILRSQAVQEVMPGVGVRPGVVTGNENLLRNEHTKAKLDTPEGQLFKQQIANEQIALSKYAEDRVNATGASPTLINDEQRGGRINDVMYGTSQDDMASSSLTGYLNQAKKQIYDSAYEKVGNNKINSSHADTLFVDPQIRATFRADGTLDVLKGAKDLIELAKTVGFKLPDGTIAPPGSVAAFDAVRKSMNKLWKPEKANAIREINQAIDKDIAAVADPALYKLGDKVHQVEKTIFGSKGIKNLFGEVDANGVITSSTPLEKIPSKLNNLPKDQWRHVRDTLDELAKGRVRGAPDGLPPVPPELQQAAAAARAEIDGALAREVQKAGSDKMGVWNQNSANKTMNSLVGEKILETFPPDEVRKFHLLNTVGQIVPGIHSYEGAALQARRVGLIEGNLGKLGTGAGAAIGGAIGEAPGAAAGAYVGGQAGVRLSEKMAAKALTKEAIKAQKEMEKAKALGQQTGKNKIQDLGK